MKRKRKLIIKKLKILSNIHSVYWRDTKFIKKLIYHLRRDERVLNLQLFYKESVVFFHTISMRMVNFRQRKIFLYNFNFVAT